MEKYDFKERYKRWWLNKYCRPAGTKMEFKKVVKVEVFGPRSFVYGSVFLTYEDGSSMPVHCGDAFKPRKMDIEVREEGINAE